MLDMYCRIYLMMNVVLLRFNRSTLYIWGLSCDFLRTYSVRVGWLLTSQMLSVCSSPVDCISRLSGFVELTLRYTTPDVRCRHWQYECDGEISVRKKSHDNSVEYMPRAVLRLEKDRSDGRTDGRTDRQTDRRTDGRHCYAASVTVVISLSKLPKNLESPLFSSSTPMNLFVRWLFARCRCGTIDDELNQFHLPISTMRQLQVRAGVGLAPFSGRLSSADRPNDRGGRKTDALPRVRNTRRENYRRHKTRRDRIMKPRTVQSHSVRRRRRRRRTPDDTLRRPLIRLTDEKWNCLIVWLT